VRKQLSSKHLQRINDLLKSFPVECHLNTTFFIEQILLLLKEQEEARLERIAHR